MPRKFLMPLLVVLALTAGCAGPSPATIQKTRNAFVSWASFSSFTRSQGAAPDEIVLLSPEIPPPNDWDELIVSWNVPPGVYVKVEARGVYPDHATKYYCLGYWSDDASQHPRRSVNGQQDPDGTVRTDTLMLNRPGAKAQVRITLGGTGTGSAPQLKFLGLSFCDSRTPSAPSELNRVAWGVTLTVPERVQSGYEGPGGWCSPASVSMLMACWSAKLHRPELDRAVPEVAAAVNDPVYGGTGNWTFNTAFAGMLPGLRAYVRRFDDISELEDWIAAGIPVVLSVSSYLTRDPNSGPDNGHLVVCAGFTETGDVVVNDPGVSVRRGERVRRIYAREKVIEAWQKSKNTVYLIYPEDAVIPRDRHGHWEHGGRTQ